VKHCARHASFRLLVLLLGGTPAFAFAGDGGDPIRDEFNIDLGTFFYGSGTTISLNNTFTPNGTAGTPIDAERALGFHDSKRFRLDAYWRFTKHQRIRVIYFDASREASKILEQTFTFGRYTFPVGAAATTQNNVSIAELAYEYDFLVRDNFSLGASIGIHNFDYSLGINAATTVAAPNMPTSISQTASADGPMPLIGLAAIWRVTPEVYFTGLAQGLKVTVNPYSGTLQNYGMTVTWQPFRHFGVGAGYDYFSLRAGVNAHTFNGDLDWNYSGPRVFVSGSF
jgi:hypothetical protein